MPPRLDRKTSRYTSARPRIADQFRESPPVNGGEIDDQNKNKFVAPGGQAGTEEERLRAEASRPAGGPAVQEAHLERQRSAG